MWSSHSIFSLKLTKEGFYQLIRLLKKQLFSPSRNCVVMKFALLQLKTPECSYLRRSICLRFSNLNLMNF